MATNPNRVPRGVPTGGRYAPSAHPRPTTSLDAEPATPGVEWTTRTERAPDGGRFEWRYAGGKLSDPPDGTPAVRRWAEDGQLTHEAHYTDGKLSDPPDGTPAVRRWAEDGQLAHEAHYTDGKLNDPPDGTPASRWWDTNGQLTHEHHFFDGRFVEAPASDSFDSWATRLSATLRAGDRPETETITSPLGTHGWSIETDEDGEEYLAVGMTLPDGVMAEVDGGTFGSLNALRFYTGRRGDDDERDYCDECTAEIRGGFGVSDEHYASCSLHPDNIG